ncbi:MAG: hypothetical protein Q4G21_05745 [Dermabacter sp.]|nr:hypothetical protein [Dermabacter sp.]
MESFALGADVARTLAALGVISLLALAAPAFAWRGTRRHPVRARVLAGRLAAVVSSCARVSLWVGGGVGLAMLALPGAAEARFTRAGIVIAGIVLALALAWRSLSLVDAAVAGSAQERQARAHRLVPLAGATGAGATGLLVVALVAVLRQDAGQALVALAFGLGLVALTLRAAAAVAGVGASAASIGVGALERDVAPGSTADPGLEATLLSRLISDGPRRTLDAAALAALVPGVIILLGVPLLGTAAIITALVLSIALLVAHLLPAAIGGSGTARGRALAASVAGAVPIIAALSALGLWIPSAYSRLRMGQVGLGEFTDPLLISLFVDQSATEVPQAINRDLVEPQIEQLAGGFGEFYQTVGDAPSAQSVMDTIVLHTTNPAQLSLLGIGVGALFALIVGAALWWGAAPSGPLARRHARSARVGVAASSLSALNVGAPLALVLVAGLVGAWLLTTSAAGIAYLGLYLVALAAAGVAIIAAGMTGTLGGDVAAAPLETIDEVASIEEDSIEEDGATEAESDADGAEQADADAADPARAAALAHAVRAVGPWARTTDAVLGTLAVTLAGIALLAPIGGDLRAAPKILQLWSDRSLRVLYADTPTMLAAFVLGAASVLIVAALVAEPLRRVLASAAMDARAGFADGASPRVFVDEGGFATRRIAALALAVAVMAPVVAGFGLGGAAMPGFAAGALIAGGLLSIAAALGRGANSQARRLVGEGRYGGVGSFAEASTLTGALAARVRSALAGVSGAESVGAYAALTAIATYLATPLVVQFATDGTNEWLRPVVVAAALLVIAAAWTSSRAIAEPDLEDELPPSDAPLFEVRD